MTYIPRGRVDARPGGNRRNERTGEGRRDGGRGGYNDGNSAPPGNRLTDERRGGDRSGRAAGPGRNVQRQHPEHGNRLPPRNDDEFREVQPLPEHVEYGNGARRAGTGRGRRPGFGGNRQGSSAPPSAEQVMYGNSSRGRSEGRGRDGNRDGARPGGRDGSRPGSRDGNREAGRPGGRDGRRDGRGPADAAGQPRPNRGHRDVDIAPRRPREDDYIETAAIPRLRASGLLITEVDSVDRQNTVREERAVRENRPMRDDRPPREPRAPREERQPREARPDGIAATDDEQGGRRRRGRRGGRGRGRGTDTGGAAHAQAPREGREAPAPREAAVQRERPIQRERPVREPRRSRPDNDDPQFPRAANKRSRAKEERLELDILSFIRDNPVVHELEEAFEPSHEFGEFGLRGELLKNVERRGYELPTPIQDVAIPPVLAGGDVVGLANTGTGKTAAFLLPMINRMLDDPAHRALVLAPTRELAIQIEEELKLFSRGLPIRSTVIVGGVGEGSQLKSLRHDNHFIVATPGRLIDFLRRGELRLDRISMVVLDEADRMLDMGFIRDMRYIIGLVPKKRQTLFFSATMSEEIRELIGDFLHKPQTVSVVRHRVSATVVQDVISLRGENRVDVLAELLARPEFSRVLVFGRTKHGMNKLSRMLNARGLNTDAIHGNKSHNARQLALKRFKTGEISALVATDVAARGLDIDDVTHVINYELPQTYDDYIHRIGRTGRAGKTGHAITFVE